MSTLAFLLVFISVFLHVAWNFISKSTRPSLAFYALMCGTAAMIWFPFFLMSDFMSRLPEMPSAFFLLLFGSIAAEIAYIAGLAYAYRKGDISLVYPMIRAIPVLLVASVTLMFGMGKHLDGTGMLAMSVVSAGCLIMPLKCFSDFRLACYKDKIMFFVILGAAGTTLYTVFDSGSIRIMHENNLRGIVDLMGFLFCIEFGLALGLFAFVAFIPSERKSMKELFGRSFMPVLAGICSSSAYGLILLAMKHVSNVSYIQAFRQMSLPIGFLAGVILLKEGYSRPKVAGLVLIIIGLLLAIL